MKKISILALGLICALSAITLTANAISKGAIFAWSETTFDFGRIIANKPVTHEFTFVNTGTEPLVISNVKASCGCTVAEYTQEPIAPGSSGVVKAKYNAAAVGVFTKTVTVTANTEGGNVLLTLKGEVIQ